MSHNQNEGIKGRMKECKYQFDKGDNLRKRAEQLLSKKTEGHCIVATNDVKQLAYELSVHQTELEMQNEELRRAQMEIEESRSTYADLYDFAPVGYLTCNQQGLIAAANLTFASMLGIERQQLINSPFSRFVIPGYRGLLYVHVSTVFKTGTKQWCELEFMKKDGSQFYGLMKSIAVMDTDGNPTKECRSVIADITERKRTEVELKTLNEALEQRTRELQKANDELRMKIAEKELLRMEAIRARQLASLGELAAGVAHEINNPINSVINYAQILSNKSHEGSKENDIAGRIIKEGNRIAGIVGSLLSFARPGDKKGEKKVVSINGILHEALILTGTQLRRDGIRVKLDMPQNLPEIYVNDQQIQQVFLNVISNARYALNQKYPQKDEGKILEIIGEEVAISDSPQVKITFYDRGTGIPAGILDKIGESFFTTKPRNKGTGLGLSVSRGIINDHDGKLLFDSVEGEYCKVIILLPVAGNLSA